jgi:hypothetical protein
LENVGICPSILAWRTKFDLEINAITKNELQGKKLSRVILRWRQLFVLPAVSVNQHIYRSSSAAE